MKIYTWYNSRLVQWFARVDETYLQPTFLRHKTRVKFAKEADDDAFKRTGSIKKFKPMLRNSAAANDSDESHTYST